MNPSLPNAYFLGSGLELLLDEIYDTIFAGLDLASTFAETTLYRILQRRFLAVQLVISGRFRCEYKLEADVFPLGGNPSAFMSCSLRVCPTRAGVGIELTLPACRTRAVNTLTALPFLPGSLVGPTKCEVERFAATSFRHPYVPSCHPDGEYQAAQCQQGGPCWCVDSRGQEIPGTRQRGEPPSCGGCPLQASPPCSRQVVLLYLSLQTDLSRSHSFHCLPGGAAQTLQVQQDGNPSIIINFHYVSRPTLCLRHHMAVCLVCLLLCLIPPLVMTPVV